MATAGRPFPSGTGRPTLKKKLSESSIKLTKPLISDLESLK